MRRAAVAAGLLSALACGEPRATRSTAVAANGLTTRIAIAPARPDGAAAGLAAPDAPLAGTCLAGDSGRGEAWRLVGLDTVGDIGLERLTGMVPRDSVRLISRLTRTADALPNDTTIADFRGLPVSIHAAWRLVAAPTDTVFVATAVRRLPIESAPLEEQTTFIAHPVTLPSLRDPLRADWTARVVGPEGAVAPRELIKAWKDSLGIAIVVVRDDDDGLRAELLMRTAAAWRLAWVGPLRPCPGAP